MQIKDLKPNARNPRKISGSRLLALKKSLEKFGDLSGFVYNRRTKALVSGHQRQKTLPASSSIHYEVRHKEPTKARTVAEGYVLINGERFRYREVDADINWETEALLAANKHGGLKISHFYVPPFPETALYPSLNKRLREARLCP